MSLKLNVLEIRCRNISRFNIGTKDITDFCIFYLRLLLRHYSDFGRYCLHNTYDNRLSGNFLSYAILLRCLLKSRCLTFSFLGWHYSFFLLLTFHVAIFLMNGPQILSTLWSLNTCRGLKTCVFGFPVMLMIFWRKYWGGFRLPSSSQY